MKTVSLGIGLVVALLLSLALLLFSLVSDLGFIAALLLLCGAWMVLYAAVLEPRVKLYVGGWGVVVALLSSFYFIPVQYSVGLVLLALVAIIVVAAARKR